MVADGWILYKHNQFGGSIGAIPIEPDMFAHRPRSGDPSAIKKARDAAKKGGVPTKECARAAMARRWKWWNMVKHGENHWASSWGSEDMSVTSIKMMMDYLIAMFRMI